VPFSITSVTTGESHVIVTDINGEFSTASSWNPHSQHTNRGETDRDGIWFGQLETLNDDLGALLYDTYLIEELPCEANKGYELLSFEVSVYRHNTVIDLGTLTNDHIVVPEIFTTARGPGHGHRQRIRIRKDHHHRHRILQWFEGRPGVHRAWYPYGQGNGRTAAGWR
jgi:hypothetical protein